MESKVKVTPQLAAEQNTTCILNLVSCPLNLDVLPLHLQ